jgi:hypothetical protein
LGEFTQEQRAILEAMSKIKEPNYLIPWEILEGRIRFLKRLGFVETAGKKKYIYSVHESITVKE